MGYQAPENAPLPSVSNLESDWQPEVSVVIPAYNENAAIGPVLDAALALAKKKCWEIIVVDDGSSDGTTEQAAQRSDDQYLILIRHPYNQGYGAAIKTGIRRARASLVATMDSDGQHDPDQLTQLLYFTSEYPLVVGMRSGLAHSPIWRMPGKWVLSRLANYLTNQKIPDLNSGMRIFHKDVIRHYLHLCPQGFSFSTTSTMAFFSQGYAVKYVPITINPREPGGKSTVKVSTGLETFILVMRLASLFNPLRIFVPTSILLVVLGMLWGFPYILLQRGVSVGSLMLILSGLLVFFFGLLTDQVAQLRLEKFE